MDLSSEVWCAAFDSMTPEGPKYTTVPTPAGRFTDLCTGSYSCGIRESPGQVECWNPKDDVYLAPTALPQRRLESLDCLGSVMCAVIRQGALSCWANDDAPELAAGIIDPMPSGDHVVTVAVGIMSCALTRSGAIGTTRCWGVDTVGETQPPP